MINAIHECGVLHSSLPIKRLTNERTPIHFRTFSATCLPLNNKTLKRQIFSGPLFTQNISNAIKINSIR
jgi:hypothetical protein